MDFSNYPPPGAMIRPTVFVLSIVAVVFAAGVLVGLNW